MKEANPQKTLWGSPNCVPSILEGGWRPPRFFVELLGCHACCCPTSWQTVILPLFFIPCQERFPPVDAPFLPHSLFLLQLLVISAPSHLYLTNSSCLSDSMFDFMCQLVTRLVRTLHNYHAHLSKPGPFFSPPSLPPCSLCREFCFGTSIVQVFSFLNITLKTWIVVREGWRKVEKQCSNKGVILLPFLR